MRSVLGLATVAIWGAVLRDVRDQSKDSFHHCSAFAERAGASPVLRFGGSDVS
jgi:hypothetical protein